MQKDAQKWIQLCERSSIRWLIIDGPCIKGMSVVLSLRSHFNRGLRYKPKVMSWWEAAAIKIGNAKPSAWTSRQPYGRLPQTSSVCSKWTTKIRSRFWSVWSDTISTIKKSFVVVLIVSGLWSPVYFCLRLTSRRRTACWHLGASSTQAPSDCELWLSMDPSWDYCNLISGNRWWRSRDWTRGLRRGAFALGRRTAAWLGLGKW